MTPLAALAAGPHSSLLAWTLIAASGLLLGGLIAWASPRLASALGEGRGPDNARRTAAIMALGLGLALWSGAATDLGAQVPSLALAAQLLLLAILDWEHFWLPRVLTLPLIASGLVAAFSWDLPTGLEALIGAAAGFLVLGALALAYRRLRGREGLGGGDAYLLAGSGAWLGWMALPSVLLIAAALGLLGAGAARLSGRWAGSDAPLPFGVFLALATWLVWLYGPLRAGPF